jgi:hypothetical protein
MKQNPDVINSNHLTEKQIATLLEASSSTNLKVERAHLASCEACAATVQGMRDTLALFRETTIAFADRELAGVERQARRPVMLQNSFSPGLVWAAAGLLVVAGMLPLELHRVAQGHTVPQIAHATSSPSPAKAESDEALLNDINQEISASVPDSMQVLANPVPETANATSADTITRKD